MTTFKIGFQYIDQFDANLDHGREESFEAETSEDAVSQFRQDWGDRHQIEYVVEGQ